MQDIDTSLTPRSICHEIGRRKVARRIGVGITAVGNAVADGVFPARWYRAMKALCSEHGLQCPDELFNFVEPAAQETHRKTHSENTDVRSGVSVNHVEEPAFSDRSRKASA